MTKFTVVGTATACNELSAVEYILGSHAVVHGELFNRHDRAILDLFRPDTTIKVGQDPIDFLERQIFKGGENPVGFLLRGDQARCARWSRVWGYVRKHTKVVRVVENPAWSLIIGVKNFVDPISFAKAVRRHEQLHKDLVEYFARDSEVFVLDILEPDWEGMVDFLGLSDIDIPVLPKPTKLEDRIINYDELVKAFKGKSEERYLELDQ